MLRNRYYANDSFIVLGLSEFNNAISQSEDGVISSETNIFSGMIYSATLTNDDVTCNSRLTTVDLNAKAFAL